MAQPLKKLYITKQIEFIELWNTNQFVMAHSDPCSHKPGPNVVEDVNSSHPSPLIYYSSNFFFVITLGDKLWVLCNEHHLAPQTWRNARSLVVKHLVPDDAYAPSSSSCTLFQRQYTLVTIYSLQSYRLLQDLTWQIWLFSPSSLRGAKQDFPHIFFILIKNSAYQFVPVRF